jgi:transposase
MAQVAVSQCADSPPLYRQAKAYRRTGVQVDDGQWDALTLFLIDPHLPVDNNASERAVRFAALGRKNFLFVGSDEAGENLAGLYSLIATCEANGVNPVEYLADVLLRVQTHPASRIDELLPHNWTPPRPEPSA